MLLPVLPALADDDEEDDEEEEPERPMFSVVPLLGASSSADFAALLAVLLDLLLLEPTLSLPLASASAVKANRAASRAMLRAARAAAWDRLGMGFPSVFLRG